MRGVASSLPTTLSHADTRRFLIDTPTSNPITTTTWFKHAKEVFAQCKLAVDQSRFLIARRGTGRIGQLESDIYRWMLNHGVAVSFEGDKFCHCGVWSTVIKVALHATYHKEAIDDRANRLNVTCERLIKDCLSQSRYYTLARIVMDQYAEGLLNKVALMHYLMVFTDDDLARPYVRLHNYFNLLYMDMLSQEELLSAVHTAVRSTQTWFGNQLDAQEWINTQYLAEGLGRGEWPFSVPDEIKTRCMQPPMHTGLKISGKNVVLRDESSKEQLFKCIAEACREFYTGNCREDSNKLHDNKRILMDFQEFLKYSYKWIAAGSAPGFRFIYKTGAEEDRIRINKRLAVELLSVEQMLEIIEAANLAVTYSRSALKYELRKRRALWNTAVEHYLICSYIANPVEWQGMKPVWAVGYSDLPRKMQAFDTMCRTTIGVDGSAPNPDDLHNVMNDFADFNVEQELSESAFMWLYLTQLLCADTADANIISDLIDCGMWMANASANVILEDQDNGIIAKVLRGLVTGSRGTALQNTIMNRAYFLFAVDNMTHMFRLAPYPVSGEQGYMHGDDAFARLRTILALLLPSIFNMMGRATKTTKQLMLNDAAEFLRYAMIEGKFSLYPRRVVAGLITGELNESIDKNDTKSRVLAVLEVYDKTVRSLGNMSMQVLRSIIANMYTKNCSIQVNTNKGTRVLKPLISAAKAPTWLGGGGREVQLVGITTNRTPEYTIREVDKRSWALPLVGNTPDNVNTLKTINMTGQRLQQLGYDARMVRRSLDTLYAGLMGNMWPTRIVQDAYNKLGSYLSQDTLPRDYDMQRVADNNGISRDLRGCVDYMVRMYKIMAVWGVEKYESARLKVRAGIINKWFASNSVLVREQLMQWIAQPLKHSPDRAVLKDKIIGKQVNAWWHLLRGANSDNMRNIMREFMCDSLRYNYTTTMLKYPTTTGWLYDEAKSYLFLTTNGGISVQQFEHDMCAAVHIALVKLTKQRGISLAVQL